MGTHNTTNNFYSKLSHTSIICKLLDPLVHQLRSELYSDDPSSISAPAPAHQSHHAQWLSSHAPSSTRTLRLSLLSSASLTTLTTILVSPEAASSSTAPSKP